MELHHSAETEAPKKVTKLFLNRPLASTSNSIKARQPNTGPPSHDDDRKHSLSRTILQRGVIELHNRLLLNVRPIIPKKHAEPAGGSLRSWGSFMDALEAWGDSKFDRWPKTIRPS